MDNNVHVVDKERHTGRRWRRYDSYAHAATDAVAQLALPEVSRACVAMPIGFIESKRGLVPAAIQGLEPGTNLFVAEDGRWLGDYVPAAYRAYPFVLGSTHNGPVLCVLEDSGLVGDTQGEPFFDEQGWRAPFLNEVMSFMLRISSQRKTALHACSVLEKHNLVQPWPFNKPTDAGEQVIGGLYRIDRTALRQLSNDGLQEVRLAGALPLIYCQLLSMQLLPKLHQLARSRAESVGELLLSADGDLDMEFINDGETIRFGLCDPTLTQGRGGWS